MKALFISLFLCLSLSSHVFADNALSYEAAKSEMSARFQKQAVESLTRLRNGNFSDIDVEFKRFEQFIDAGVSLESIGTTKEEIYDIHLKYPSQFKAMDGDGASKVIIKYLLSPGFRREMRWGSNKMRAQKSLARMRAGNPTTDFEAELWDFEAFREAGNLSLAELGISQAEFKRLHCGTANKLWSKKKKDDIKPSEGEELLYLLKKFGPCQSGK